MPIRTIIALLATLVPMAPAYAKSEHYEVVVADPFIELHTGPGRGYPVFHVVDRGATIEVVKRRTQWYQLRTDRGIEGWVHRDQLARTLETTGEPVAIAAAGWGDFANRRWEMSVGFGDFDGASMVSLTGGWRLSTHLSAELVAAHISGDFSDGWQAAVRVVHTPFPEWRVSPFVMVGTGIVEISPRTSLVSSEDRSDQFAQAGVGLRAYLTERFMLRAEYAGDVVFTSRDENEEVEEWKLGFAFFF